MPDEKHSALDLISEILDKVIDTQQASTEAMTGLKSAVEQNGERLHELNSHFKNGFRSELKEHVSSQTVKCEDAMSNLKDEISELQITMKAFHELMSKPSYWIKLILTTVVATTTAIGGIVALIIKLMS